MDGPRSRRWRRDGTTWVLLSVYLGVSLAWRWMTPAMVVASGAGVAVALGVLAITSHRRGYFVTLVDLFLHLVVVADLLCEAVLISAQTGAGFTACAVAFGVVLLGYRAWKRENPCACRWGIGGSRP